MRRKKMSVRFTLVGALLFCVSAAAQNSFDAHFAVAKRGELGQREAAFAKECGIHRASSTITYGRSLDEGWTFKPVASIGNGREDAEMDYLGNAEMWSVEGKPRLLNIWFLVMDTGNSSNEMFCLDQNGRVIAQESLNVYEPVDGSSSGWRHLRSRSFPAAGKVHILTNTFLDDFGSPIPSPKLDGDALAAANVGSSATLAKDMIANLSRRKR